MAKIENLELLILKLKKKLAASIKDDNVSVAVGYTQNYAIYVHENMEAIHPVGQAKFLEEPARTKHKELASIFTEVKKRGQTTAQALLAAGLRLQRESQLLCPVDTGALKASAFTILEGHEQMPQPTTAKPVKASPKAKPV